MARLGPSGSLIFVTGAYFALTKLDVGFADWFYNRAVRVGGCVGGVLLYVGAETQVGWALYWCAWERRCRVVWGRGHGWPGRSEAAVHGPAAGMREGGEAHHVWVVRRSG